MVDAVLSLDEDLSLDMIGVKKIPGGALEVRGDLVTNSQIITPNIAMINYLVDRILSS